MGMIQSVGTSIGKGIAKATNSKPATWLAEKWNKNPEDTIALATVTSIVLKDGIGCFMYVTQSLNNKKIPDEKRKFVAALDLTNGVLMIAAQIAMFFAMRKYSGPIFEKIFKKSFDKTSISDIVSRIRLKAANEGKDVPRKLTLERAYQNVKDEALGLFKFVADIAAATIIGKRVIVPLIATPLAKKVEKKMDKNNDKNDTQEPVDSENSNNQDKISKEEMQPTFSNSAETNLLAKYKK